MKIKLFIIFVGSLLAQPITPQDPLTTDLLSLKDALTNLKKGLKTIAQSSLEESKFSRPFARAQSKLTQFQNQVNNFKRELDDLIYKRGNEETRGDIPVLDKQGEVQALRDELEIDRREIFTIIKNLGVLIEIPKEQETTTKEELKAYDTLLTEAIKTIQQSQSYDQEFQKIKDQQPQPGTSTPSIPYQGMYPKLFGKFTRIQNQILNLKEMLTHYVSTYHESGGGVHDLLRIIKTYQNLQDLLKDFFKEIQAIIAQGGFTLEQKQELVALSQDVTNILTEFHHFYDSILTQINAWKNQYVGDVFKLTKEPYIKITFVLDTKIKNALERKIQTSKNKLLKIRNYVPLYQ